VVLRETGLIARVPEDEVTLRDPNSTLLAHNPGGKVPSLQLDNGTILNESLLVLAHLDTRHEGSRLLPMDGSEAGRSSPRPGRPMPFSSGVRRSPRRCSPRSRSEAPLTRPALLPGGISATPSPRSGHRAKGA